MSVDLAALIGSRICHDLVSPLGAIGNGLELMELNGQGQSPEMDLVLESVANANARLRFFRVAFGIVGDEQRMGRAEVLSTLSATARGGKIRYDWRAGGDYPRADVRIIFLALMCLDTALPFGGEVEITEIDGHWHLTAAADRIRHLPELWASLSDGPETLGRPLAPAEVQFGLLPQALSAHGRSLALAISETKIEMRIA